MRLWHAGTGTLRSILRGHKARAGSLLYPSLCVRCHNDITHSHSRGMRTTVLPQPKQPHFSVALYPRLANKEEWKHCPSANLQEAVRCVAVAPGGRIISGSVDKTLRVWSIAEGGGKLHKLKGHAAPVRAVVTFTLSEGGAQMAASASDDGSIRVWDIDAGALQFALLGAFLLSTTGRSSSIQRNFVLLRSQRTAPPTRARNPSPREPRFVSRILLLSCAPRLSLRPSGPRCFELINDHLSILSRRALWPRQRDLPPPKPNPRQRQLGPPCRRLVRAGNHRTTQRELLAFCCWHACLTRCSPGANGNISCLLPRRRSLATGGAERVMEGHQGPIQAVCKASRGRVVSSSLDKRIRLWQTSTGARNSSAIEVALRLRGAWEEAVGVCSDESAPRPALFVPLVGNHRTEHRRVRARVRHGAAVRRHCAGVPRPHALHRVHRCARSRAPSYPPVSPHDLEPSTSRAVPV